MYSFNTQITSTLKGKMQVFVRPYLNSRELTLAVEMEGLTSDKIAISVYN